MSAGVDGVPGQLHELASRAAALAEQVRARSTQVRGHARTGWSGPAADAYARAVATEAARLDRCAGRLDDLVAAIRGHARGAEQRLDEVADLFAAARQALESSAGLLPRAGGGR
jgi:uncharacterized protein YukE